MLESLVERDGRTKLAPATDGIVVPVHSKELLLRRLTDAIRSGQLRPGERLMTERAIANGSGLARSTIRDVLAELERMGFIHRKVGRGTFVASEPAEPPPVVARFSPAELIEFRQAFEPALAELIVLKASEAELEAIRSLTVSGRAVTDWQGCEQNDGAFHASLCEAAHNAMVSRVGAEIAAGRMQPGWLRIKELNFSMASWPLYQSEHEAIAEALCMRDAVKARDLLRRHLLDVRAGWAL